MTLITDGGSTKCDWVLLDGFGDVVFKTVTPGLNPTVVSKEEMMFRITSNTELLNIFESVETLHFYGAGCGTATPRQLLLETFNKLFINAKITIFEDILAAVFAATTAPGIVCILGTGSNSCFFDGKKVHTPIPALGFILMDEASGNYFGKRLIRDYFYGRMPREIASEFRKNFNLDADEIKMNLYHKPNTNAYLATFSQFIFTEKEINPYFYAMLKTGLSDFIESRVLCFENAREVPVHFVGSIAHFSEEIIRESFDQYRLQLGKILQRPIDGLTNYYKTQISNS